jgi:UDP-glucose 4-epimerase
MIIFQRKDRRGKEFKIILLFGTGLIGTSIYNSINRQAVYSSSYFPFNWNCPEQGKKDAAGIFQYLTSDFLVSCSHYASSQIAFVWCAGKAGFTATKKIMNDELISYGTVLDLVRRIKESFSGSKIFIHLLSSSGGLFEGQRLINDESVPQPKRFYGHLKYVQEQRLMELNDEIAKKVYRLTSVYGFVGPGQRMGLIPTLIANGMRNKVSTIFGSSSTLRDYVLNEDVGFYIKKKLFHDCGSGNTAIYLLGSGKPSSILEIRHFVEEVIGRKIYLEFRKTSQTENTLDITLNSSALPVDWSPTDIISGIRLVKEGIISGKVSRVPGKNRLPFVEDKMNSTW